LGSTNFISVKGAAPTVFLPGEHHGNSDNFSADFGYDNPNLFPVRIAPSSKRLPTLNRYS
jgi:hypothetical protein